MSRWMEPPASETCHCRITTAWAQVLSRRPETDWRSRDVDGRVLSPCVHLWPVRVCRDTVVVLVRLKVRLFYDVIMRIFIHQKKNNNDNINNSNNSSNNNPWDLYYQGYKNNDKYSLSVAVCLFPPSVCMTIHRLCRDTGVTATEALQLAEDRPICRTITIRREVSAERYASRWWWWCACSPAK